MEKIRRIFRFLLIRRKHSSLYPGTAAPVILTTPRNRKCTFNHVSHKCIPFLHYSAFMIQIYRTRLLFIKKYPRIIRNRYVMNTMFRDVNDSTFVKVLKFKKNIIRCTFSKANILFYCFIDTYR